MRLTVPLEIDIDTTSLKEGENMKLSVSGSLSISGQVFVSGGGASDAIQDALDGSSNTTAWFDMSDPTTFGSPTDGGAVSSISDKNGGALGLSFGSGWTYNASEKGFNGTGASDVTPTGFATGTEFGSGVMDVYLVLNTTDATFPILRWSASEWAGYAIDGNTTAPATQNATIASHNVNGVDQAPANTDEWHADVSTGSKIIVSLRGVDLSGFDSSAGRGVLSYNNTASLRYAGLFADMLFVDAQDNDSHAAIVAQLAARHGITL